MTSESGPFVLADTRLVMGPSGEATPMDVTPSFYADLDGQFEQFAGHVLVSRFDFDEPWPTWEMHPKGDEFVYLLSGDVDFLLKSDAGEQRLHIDQPGAYVVVPKGTWHTAHPNAPTSMLFITPGEGTENRETPG